MSLFFFQQLSLWTDISPEFFLVGRSSHLFQLLVYMDNNYRIYVAL